MKFKLDDFQVGYAMACANVQSLHDEPTIAGDALIELGLTKDQILNGFGWTEYDLAAFEEIFTCSRWEK